MFNFDSFKAIESFSDETSFSSSSCLHSETCIEKDVEFCIDCGEEIKKICEWTGKKFVVDQKHRNQKPGSNHSTT